MAAIFPDATSRGRYFMPQSVQTMMSLGITNGSARRMRAATTANDSSRPRMDEGRGRIRTDAEGRYWFRSIKPTFYPVPTDGPVGRMLHKMGRHPYRPGHIHMIVSAPGHLPVTTHLFVAGSEYLDSDAVFGMKQSLVAQFNRHPPGIGPHGERMNTAFYTVNYDFRLRPANE
jgi:protocatechuate 3,4-dioxygenase beta subunit